MNKTEEVREYPLPGKKYRFFGLSVDEMVHAAVHKFHEDMHVFPTDISVHVLNRLPYDHYGVLEMIGSPPPVFITELELEKASPITYKRILIKIHYRSGLELDEVRCVSLEG